LATLRQRWGILLPLDPRIPALPVRASAVFADTPHDFSVVYSMKEPLATITLKVRSGASKKPIFAELDELLSFAIPRLDRQSAHHPKRVKARGWEMGLSYYSTLFQVYDLERAGQSHAAIAKVLFPKVFEDHKKPFDSSNQEYHKAIQHVKDFLEAAEKLINNI
jgi:hypothetical protein